MPLNEESVSDLHQEYYSANHALSHRIHSLCDVYNLNSLL